MASSKQWPPTPPVPPHIVMFAMFAWLCVVGWWVWHGRAWLAQRTWEQVTAQVENVKFEVGAFDRLSHNCPRTKGNGAHTIYTTYSYEFEGSRYTAKAYDHVNDGELICGKEKARKREAELNEAGELEVWVNPSDPSRAVVQLQSGSEVISVFILLGGAAVALVLWLRRQRRLWAEYQVAQRAYADS